MDQAPVGEVSRGKAKYIGIKPKNHKFHDLIVKGGAFYAFFNQNTRFWSRDAGELSDLLDESIDAESRRTGLPGLYLNEMNNGEWQRYIQKMRYIPDSDLVLDQKIMFNDRDPVRDDYATHQLSYSPTPIPTPHYDALMTTLYAPEERDKIEWSIGALIHGKDLKQIQKMFVLFGDVGTGKSTVLDIIELLFPGYITYFNAKDLGQGYTFATAVFKNTPMIAIQHDGDLSKMWDNATINQIVSHEVILINEKGINQYPLRMNTFIYMGTNKPVKITDSRSGLLRRLIDIQPTGRKLPTDEYFKHFSAIQDEIPGIAQHCLDLYLSYGENYYSSYRPLRMLSKTNNIYNFIQENFMECEQKDGATLAYLWKLYKAWCEDANIPSSERMKRSDFAFELEAYFNTTIKPELGESTRGVIFKDLKMDKFHQEKPKLYKKPIEQYHIRLNKQHSLIDDLLADEPAQYARTDASQAPQKPWDSVTTTLNDIDTSQLHYVHLPENHIVIDFDLTGKDGKKSLSTNLKLAEEWPATYAEVSKSGGGLHLHYIYDGDPSKLSNMYEDHIEIKHYTGKGALRRKLTMCNNQPLAHIPEGELPIKEVKNTLNSKEIKDEQHLRNIIKHALHKEYNGGTKDAVSFISKVTDEAYESKMHYDIRDMQNELLQFALGSSHWADMCVGMVGNMHLHSDDISDGDVIKDESARMNDSDLVFYDVEVFPNLFLVCFKHKGKDNVEAWCNPSRKDVMALMESKLVGFNNRKYDNHMLYAWAYLGYSNMDLYKMSKRIVDGDRSALFGEAYNISYTDVYDFSTKKQSLKKWEIELGIDHHELGMDWNSPQPKDTWPTIISYCKDDVRATEAVFDHLHDDYVGRKILAAMSGLSMNHTTNQHTAQIIFGNDRHPQDKFNYPDLSELFPGYTFDKYAPKELKSTYMGEHPSEGGYVWVYGMDNGDSEQDYKTSKLAWER